jgi:hypothetical protein
MKNKIRKVGYAAVWLTMGYLGLFWPQHYSVESILSTSVTDEVFGGMWQLKRHMIFRFANESGLDAIEQRERHVHILDALNATITVLQKVGLEPFIDAGTLLGWYRHNGEAIPWDIDADVGILGDLCREKYPDQAALLELLRSEIQPDYYHVEVFDCTYPPRPGTDFTGIITDTRNGFKVDVFSYNTVDASNDAFSWRKGRDWLLRDDEKDRHYRVTPRESILPLQYGNYSGIVGTIIPNDPEERLRWDFGMVLGAHIFPYRLNMDITMSVWSFIGVLLVLLRSRDVLFVVTVAVACLLFAGGLRVTLLVVIFAFLHRSQGKPHDRFTENALVILTVASLMYDMRPISAQVYAHIMETLGVNGFRLNPDRYCFLHEDIFCIDY